VRAPVTTGTSACGEVGDAAEDGGNCVGTVRLAQPDSGPRTIRASASVRVPFNHERIRVLLVHRG